jgi:hypothetical protein
MLWFCLQLSSEIFLILRTTEEDIIKNVYWSSCKVPAITLRFEWILNFLHRFSNRTQIPNFMKIRPVGTQLFHVVGRMDRQTWRSYKSLLKIVRTRLNTTANIRLRLLNSSAQQEILYGTKYGQLRNAASSALDNYWTNKKESPDVKEPQIWSPSIWNQNEPWICRV